MVKFYTFAILLLASFAAPPLGLLLARDRWAPIVGSIIVSVGAVLAFLYWSVGVGLVSYFCMGVVALYRSLKVATERLNPPEGVVR